MSQDARTQPGRQSSGTSTRSWVERSSKWRGRPRGTGHAAGGGRAAHGGRRFAEVAAERAVERREVAEAAVEGDGRDLRAPRLRVCQPPPGLSEALLEEVFREGRPGLLEDA